MNFTIDATQHPALAAARCSADCQLQGKGAVDAECAMLRAWQVGEYQPEFNGLDPAFQTDYMGMQYDGQYCNHTTMTCLQPKCTVKNTASCYNHYIAQSIAKHGHVDEAGYATFRGLWQRPDGEMDDQNWDNAAAAALCEDQPGCRYVGTQETMSRSMDMSDPAHMFTATMNVYGYCLAADSSQTSLYRQDGPHELADSKFCTWSQGRFDCSSLEKKDPWGFWWTHVPWHACNSDTDMCDDLTEYGTPPSIRTSCSATCAKYK